VRAHSSIPFALVLLAHASTAHANDSVRAQALFEEARVLMARGDYAAACPKLEGSQSLDPGPGTEYNLALCYEKSGRTASAWAAYLSAAAAYKATNRPEWESRARDRATALAAVLSRVTIIVPAGAPPDLKITRDGAPVIASEIGVPIPVDPGLHVFAATAERRPKWSTEVNLAPGAQKTVEIVFADAPRGATTPNANQDAPSSSSSQKTIAYVVGGVGVAGVIVGTVAGLITVNENAASTKECPNDGVCRSDAALDANASARSWATVSTVSFIAAGVLLAAGVALYLTAPTTPARSSFARGVIAAW
jgi:hypothetical protein